MCNLCSRGIVQEIKMGCRNSFYISIHSIQPGVPSPINLIYRKCYCWGGNQISAWCNCICIPSCICSTPRTLSHWTMNCEGNRAAMLLLTLWEVSTLNLQCQPLLDHILPQFNIIQAISEGDIWRNLGLPVGYSNSWVFQNCEQWTLTLYSHQDFELRDCGRWADTTTGTRDETSRYLWQDTSRTRDETTR